MGTQKVIESDRIKRRRVANALGNDPVRFLAELITNADDSYRRLENAEGATLEFINKPKQITVIFNSKKGQGNEFFEVIDRAEGMNEERLKTVFGVYAGDNAGGDEGKTRGIFGQGASDVLKGAAIKNKRAQILSIKDGVVSKLKYIFDGKDFSIDTETLSLNVNALKDLREKYNIPENGTIITFGVPDSMKVNTTTLKTSLETNYMFHYLFNQENREVSLQIITKKELEEPIVLSSKQFDLSTKKLLTKETFPILFEGQSISSEVSFYENESKEADGIQLLVCDENNVIFDNTMFGRERNPSLQTISGILVIKGLYEICKTHLNKKEDPDAIISDNRTGFDPKNPFYKALYDVIDPIIAQVIHLYGKKTESTDLTKNKKFSDVLRKLNKFLSEELEEDIGGGKDPGIDPPANGIAFARDNIAITKGKTYNLRFYINSNVVAPNTPISFSIENTPYVDLETTEVSYQPEEILDNGLVVKSVRLTGNEITPSILGGVTLSASVGTSTAACYITVIDINVHYPENGIEFWPKKVRAKEGLPHKTYLYIDTKVIPTGMTIQFSSDEGLDLDQSNIEVAAGQIVEGSGIAKIEVISTGGSLDNSYVILAKTGDYQANVKLTITSSERDDEGSAGFLRGMELKDLGPTLTYVDAWIDKEDKKLYINRKSRINLMCLDMENVDAKAPKFKSTELKYLSEIISEQVASFAIKSKDSFTASLPEDAPVEAYDKMRNEILLKKSSLFASVYQSFIGEES